MSVLVLHDALHSCENNVTFGECNLHIQPDVARYCGKHMLNCTDTYFMRVCAEMWELSGEMPEN